MHELFALFVMAVAFFLFGLFLMKAGEALLRIKRDWYGAPLTMFGVVLVVAGIMVAAIFLGKCFR
jgi:hypothetical protein